MKTHTLRDAGENGGYVRLVGKLKSGLLEDWGDAAVHTASSARDEMNVRYPALCILNHE